jgi:hypothetical protein
MTKQYIDLPVQFTATIIPPRARNPRSVTLFAVHTFEVESVAAEDLEVAARIRFQWHNSKVPETVQIPFYDFKDQLVRPTYLDDRCNSYGFSEASLLTESRINQFTQRFIQAARGGYRSSYDAFYPAGDRHPYRKHLSGTDVARCEYREWHGDNRAEAVAKLQQWVDQCVMVNGFLCTPHEGPCWLSQNEHRHGDANDGIGHHIVRALPHQIDTDDSYFSPQALDAAIAAAERETRQQNESIPTGPVVTNTGQPAIKPAVYDGVVGQIDIYKPELLPITDINRLLKHAHRRLEDQARYTNTQFSPEAFLAMANVREDRLAMERGEPVDEIGAVDNLLMLLEHWPEEKITVDIVRLLDRMSDLRQGGLIPEGMTLRR